MAPVKEEYVNLPAFLEEYGYLAEELEEALLNIEANCPVEYRRSVILSATQEMVRIADCDRTTMEYEFVIPQSGYADTKTRDVTTIHYGWFDPENPMLHIQTWYYDKTDYLGSNPDYIDKEPVNEYAGLMAADYDEDALGESHSCRIF